MGRPVVFQEVAGEVTTPKRGLVRTTLPPIILVLTVGALCWVQYQWLAQLEGAARDRMGRDLRVAVQATATEMSLELVRLSSTVERAGSDSIARAAAWAEWRATAADIGDLFREVFLRPLAPTGAVPSEQGSALELTIGRVANGQIVAVIDSVRLVDSLLPRLSRRIASAAELAVTLSLAYRGSDGRTWIAGRTGDGDVARPDVVTPILAADSRARMVFMSDGTPPGGSASGQTGRLTWSPDTAQVAMRPTVAGAGWQLEAWHGAGSLEQAARQVRYRNLGVGFGLIVVLTAAGTVTLVTQRRSTQLAEDRAAILAGISHEVRTPLAVLRSAADNLAAGVLRQPSEVMEYGRLMESEAGKLERLIEGALGFAQAADPRVGDREAVDLRELTDEVLASTEGRPRVAIESAGPARVHANRPAIGMAIRNLVDNALRYSPADTPVTVRILRDGPWMRLTVTDEGAGVSAADRARIFEPFFRGAAATASRQSGLGLGLSLAHRVAALHRGRLRVEPSPRGGSAFHLELPVA